MSTSAGAPIVVDDFLDVEAEITEVAADLAAFAEQPACRASHSGDQVISINTLTAITFDAADTYDFGDCHDPGSSEVKNPGARGLCSGLGHVVWEPQTLGYRNVYIQVNGTTTISDQFGDGIAAATNGFTIPWDSPLDPDDYVEVLVFFAIDGGSPSTLQLGHGYLTLARYRDA